MSDIANRLVTDAMRPLDAKVLPPILADRIEAHRQTLSALAMALLNTGISEEQTRETISTALSSFEFELRRTVAAMEVENDE